MDGELFVLVFMCWCRLQASCGAHAPFLWCFGGMLMLRPMVGGVRPDSPTRLPCSTHLPIVLYCPFHVLPFPLFRRGSVFEVKKRVKFTTIELLTWFAHAPAVTMILSAVTLPQDVEISYNCEALCCCILNTWD